MVKEMKTLLGKDLVFISRIMRDGSGVEILKDIDMSYHNETEFKIISLSILNETYLASNFNLYIVKFKNEKTN